MQIKRANKYSIRILLSLVLISVLYACGNEDNNYQRAKSYYEKRDYRKAIVVLDKILENDSLNIKAIRLRGFSYYRVDAYPMAIKDLEKAYKTNALDTIAIFYLGDIMERFGNLPRALEYFRIVVNLQKNKIAPLNREAMIFDKIGEYDAAMTDCAKALKVDTNEHGTLNNIGLIY